MAIDSREKRMAMLGFGGGHNWDTLFEADGAIDADDRYHSIDLYSGFGASGSGDDTALTGIHTIHNITDVT